jgi:CheY-like chemotaxis protein
MIEGGDIDVLLTDQRMPGMSGVELCRIFKDGGKNRRRCYVVTGLINDEELTTAAKSGEIDGIISKPYNKSIIENSLKG